MTTNQARFDWQDPLNIDSQLTEDERMVRDTARDYARDRLMFHTASLPTKSKRSIPDIAR